MLSVRPKVAELVFQLYGRPLHPELFEVHNTRTVSRGDYEAQVQITSAGHVVTWRCQGLTLTEVATSAHHPLPEKRRLLSYRLLGERSDRLECRGGAAYEVRFELERVDPEIFRNYQRELFDDIETEGMLFRFDSSGRMAMGAMSYISLQSRARTLQVRAFHTFPDDYAIVKTQSLFEIP
ncbi:MAG: DUF2617 family protein [Planctomycetota bacterium]|nr:MAG: DUF2617 family protein [Planctomycetota bacterium]REJ89955.1 MAG: DUF2617 family protein [Planctomycetota bacterium]